MHLHDLPVHVGNIRLFGASLAQKAEDLALNTIRLALSQQESTQDALGPLIPETAQHPQKRPADGHIPQI